MRINKIRFQNINSLRGVHLVDFNTEPLKTAGLFAITGPTGSGKSTILDVICLALFNKVPRIDASISTNLILKTGSILTRNTKEAYAEVEYSCNEGVFRSRWSISTTRTDTLRDYEMEVVDLSTGKGIDAKKSEVPKINEGHIGLNYAQFVKSVMLAQGEFAKFLQSKKSERAELLEKITGTGIYRELGRKAFEKFREHGQELDNLRKEQTIYKEQLLGEKALLEAQAQHEESRNELLALEKDISKTQKQIETLGELEKLKAELENQLEQKAELISAREAFAAKDGIRIQGHEALSPFSKRLADWQLLKAEIEKSSNELKGLENEIVHIESTYAQWRKQAAKLVGDNFSEADVFDSLEQFALLIGKLVKERDELRNTFREVISGLKILNRYGASIDAGQLKGSIDQYQKIKKNTLLDTERLNKSIPNHFLEKPHESIGLLEDRLEFIKEAVPLEKLVADQNDRISKQSKELEALTERLKQLPAEIKNLEQQKRGQEKATENISLKIENQRLKAELESHRQHLKDGEPCPLCGALDHPYAQHSEVEETAFDKELRAEREKLDKLTETLAERKAELTQASSEKKKNLAELSAEQERLKELNQRLDYLLQNFGNKELEKGLSPMLAELKSQRETLHQYINAREKYEVLNSVSDDIERLQNAYALGIEKSNEIKKHYSGNDLQADIQKIRDGLQQNTQLLSLKQESTAKLQSSLEEKSKEASYLEKKLIPELQKLGYEAIGQAIEARLDESIYRELLDQKNGLHQSIKLNDQQLELTEKSIVERQSQVASLNPEMVEQELSNALLMKQELTDSFNAIDRRLRNHADDTARVEQLQKQIEKAEGTGKKWVLLNQYIGDARGKRFNDFAQDLTLAQLVGLANRRLGTLSDRYLLDKSQQKEDDSLAVIDAHMGNERRSVKTLSGGETFILSLSLALALSDLASRNVEINSLFIDEGFGTLDPEVLDQTLDTLERLQSEGSKTIGIISHVEALKERITTQIQLVRNGQGYSTLKVVAQ